MKWTKELATGLDVIDSQHKELFTRVDRLLSACLEGKGGHELKEIVEFMKGYIILHFGEEEKYMARYEYPDYPYHKEQHNYFADELIRIGSALNTDGARPDILMHANFILVDWEIDHIKNVDTKLVDFLKERLK